MTSSVDVGNGALYEKQSIVVQKWIDSSKGRIALKYTANPFSLNPFMR
jgi:hypothetical protein